jgi:hypothetical protein
VIEFVILFDVLELLCFLVYPVIMCNYEIKENIDLIFMGETRYG